MSVSIKYGNANLVNLELTGQKATLLCKNRKMDENVTVTLEGTGGMPVRGKIVEEIVAEGKTISAGDFVEKISGGSPSMPLDAETISYSNQQSAIYIDSKTIIYAYQDGKSTCTRKIVYTEADGMWKSSVAKSFSNSLTATSMPHLLRLSENFIILVNRYKASGSSTSYLQIHLLDYAKFDYIDELSFTFDAVDRALFYVDKASDTSFFVVYNRGGLVDSSSGVSIVSSYSYAEVFTILENSGEYSIVRGGKTLLLNDELRDNPTIEGSLTTYGADTCRLRDNIWIHETYAQYGSKAKIALSVFHISGVTAILDKSMSFIVEDLSDNSRKRTMLVNKNSNTALFDYSNILYKATWDGENISVENVGMLDSPDLNSVRYTFYRNGFLLRFSYYKGWSELINDTITVKSEIRIPYASSTVFQVLCPSSNVFWVFKPYERVIYEVKMEDGYLSENVPSPTVVQPAISSQFLYGVAVDSGNSGDTIKVAIPSID